jgi:hypothetical protein
MTCWGKVALKRGRNGRGGTIVKKFINETFKLKLKLFTQIPELAGCFLWAFPVVPIIGLIGQGLDSEPLIRTSALTVQIASNVNMYLLFFALYVIFWILYQIKSVASLHDTRPSPPRQGR